MLRIFGALFVSFPIKFTRTLYAFHRWTSAGSSMRKKGKSEFTESLRFMLADRRHGDVNAGESNVLIR